MMDLTSRELDCLYVLVRHESIKLNFSEPCWQAEPNSYAERIYALDSKLTQDFHKRHQTIR